MYGYLLGMVFSVFMALWGCALMAFGFMGGFTPPSFPGFSSAPPAAKAGVGKEAASVGDLGFVDSINRHNVVASVDTYTALTYAKGVSVGNVKVPVDAGYLSRIDISASGDFSNTITNGLYCTTHIRLSGNALVTSGWHRYAGPAYAGGGKTTTCGACRGKVVSYATKIPVKGGNELQIDAMMTGSDIGDLSVAVCLVFTKKGRDYGIIDGDVREADLTTKDSDGTLTTLGADTLGNLVIPAGLNHIPAFYAVTAVGVGVDYAGQTRSMVILSLGGNAMGISGFYHYLCETEMIAMTTTGGWLVASEPDVCNIQIDTKPGNVLELHAMMVEEDPGLINVMVGVLYGSTEAM